MPAPNTVTTLLDLIRKSGLIETAKLEAYLTTHPGPYEAPTDLVLRLQADGLITPFQGEQLLRGKYRGFFLGKYKLLDRIGLGGMGQVFLAEHAAMKRRVALKVLPPDRAENVFNRERFLREARAVGQLDHPNLVRAFDVDSEADVIFLVMEYVDGVTFHDLVSRFGPVDPQRTAYYLWQAAQGLDYLSSNGLVHRDIKPSNMLVDRNGVVKILDLGLVRSQIETDELTRNEGVKILGTADYLAPEQAVNCSTVDCRADLYSLGASGYFLLTGRPPFGGDKVAQKLIAHQVQQVTPVHEVNPAVPIELSNIIHKMLAKKLQDRYQTPTQVVSDLECFSIDPPEPPSEQEIPFVSGVGSPSSAVSLGGTPLRSPRSGGSSSSGIRFNSDSNIGIGSRPIAKMYNSTAAANGQPNASNPVPKETSQKRSPSLVSIADPPPIVTSDKPAEHKSSESGHKPFFVVPKSLSEFGTSPTDSWSRNRKLRLVLAFGLTLAVAGWNVAVLTGAFTSPVQKTATNKPVHNQQATTPKNHETAKL